MTELIKTAAAHPFATILLSVSIVFVGDIILFSFVELVKVLVNGAKNDQKTKQKVEARTNQAQED